MTSVAPLTRAAADVLRICDSLGRRACLIGGIAVQRWGQPRATQDVDVTVLAPVGVEAAVIDELLGSLTARVPDARRFALDHRVLLHPGPEPLAPQSRALYG